MLQWAWTPPRIFPSANKQNTTTTTPPPPGHFFQIRSWCKSCNVRSKMCIWWYFLFLILMIEYIHTYCLLCRTIKHVEFFLCLCVCVFLIVCLFNFCMFCEFFPQRGGPISLKFCFSKVNIRKGYLFKKKWIEGQRQPSPPHPHPHTTISCYVPVWS